MRRGAPRFLILGLLTFGLPHCSSDVDPTDGTTQAAGAVRHSDNCTGNRRNCPADSGTATDSGSGGATDSGSVVDAGSMSTDTGTGSTDTGAGTTDSGASASDTGAGITDTGAGSTDSGAGTTDSGARAIDAGAGTTDSGPSSTDAGSTSCMHDATTVDDSGQPRDADGHIRFCWPGEANCYCDSDNDCYALEGYVPCATSGGGSTTTDAGSSTDSATTVDSGSRTDAATTTDSGGSTNTGTTILPAFDSATEAHVRSVIATGLSLGNRREVFAKIGDSITESASFLSDIGYGWYTLGNHGDLLPVIQQFSSVSVGGGANSFNRASLCATAGWTTDDALAGGTSSPLVRELDAIHPMFAIVMYGTNDLERSNLTTYTANLNTIIDIIEAHGTVAILSTIPPRTDNGTYGALVANFNSVVRTLASNRHLPLIDYNIAMSPLPASGLSNDGVHPSLYLDQGGTLTDTGLQYGYNMRNLTALQMLQRVMAY